MGGGGGGEVKTLHTKGRGCSKEILNKTPKGDQSGRGPGFFFTPTRDQINFIFLPSAYRHGYI